MGLANVFFVCVWVFNSIGCLFGEGDGAIHRPCTCYDCLVLNVVMGQGNIDVIFCL